MSLKISVIIPVYNTSVYLEQCLESLISQTLMEIEIICINDGSTDNSLSILETYKNKDSRIKIINQQNKGQSSARNSGIEAAQGEYIAFLDSDDYVKNDFLEKLYKNAKNFDSDISMCSIEIFDENTGKNYSHSPYLSLDIFDKSFENRCFLPSETFDFLFRICVVPWNKIYKRDFLNKNNLKFVENLNFEDNVFFIDAYTSAHRISIVKEELVIYRQNSQTSYSSAVKKHDKKKLDFFKIFELEEKILKQKNIYHQLKEYFEFTKLNSLKDWYDKITDIEVKKEYEKIFDTIYPHIKYIKKLLPIFEFVQYIKLKSLLKNHTIVFWGANKYLENFIKKFNLKNNNILAVIDKSPTKQNTKIFDYKVVSPKQVEELEPDYIVPTVLNIYAFENIIKKEINITDEKIKKIFTGKFFNKIR